MAGCVLTVLRRSRADPSMTILVTLRLRISSACEKTSRAAGDTSATRRPMPACCEPCPGKMSASLAERCGVCSIGLIDRLRTNLHHDITAPDTPIPHTACEGMHVILRTFSGGMPVRGRDVLSIADLSSDEVERILHVALSLKRDGGGHDLLRGNTLALIFEKPSLRTRVSFDVAMQELGGHAIYLSQAEVGLGQREPVSDIARVLSRYVDVIAARTYAHQTLLDLARHATVPVINALSDEEHPCQAMADVLTILEKFGSLRGVRLAFVRDCFNVAMSLAEAAALAGMSFTMASPAGYSLPEATLRLVRRLAQENGGSVDIYESPAEAVR